MASHFDTVIVGGGPAGLISAYFAASHGKSVLLLEKNPVPALKLRITGKGRCNLTNNCTVGELLQNVPVNPKFLMSAFSRFSAQDTMAFFESLGLSLKTERGNRVFPVSDKAKEVADVLIHAVRSRGVVIKKASALDLLTNNGALSGVKTSIGDFFCTSCVLATGGLSYPKTGSTGDGYRMASALGHTIIPPKASLVPLEASTELCRSLQGLSLKNVALRVFKEGSEIFSDFGEMLFTHFGVSGPLILSASSHMRDFTKHHFSLLIDLKPALSADVLDKRLLRDFSENGNRDLANGLNRLLPLKLIPVIIALSGIPPHQKIHSVTKEERLHLAQLIKAFPLDVIGPRPIDEAVITSGGISVREINPKTMESKLVKGLYFAGEIIDTDAYTGGFNLQIAWSTGFAAGSSIADADDSR